MITHALRWLLGAPTSQPQPAPQPIRLRCCVRGRTVSGMPIEVTVNAASLTEAVAIATDEWPIAHVLSVHATASKP